MSELELLEKFENFCRERNISGDEKKRLEEKLKKLIEKAKFEPGEAIGIITAHSLSEPATQMTMRAYHFAASAGIQMSLGLPRLIELFDLRKNIDNVITIYLEENSKELAEKIATEITESTIGDITSSISFDILENVVELVIDRDLMSNLGLTYEDLDQILNKSVKKYKVTRKSNKIHISGDNLSYKEYRALKEKLLTVHVKGIKGIKESLIFEKDGEWVIQLKGGNFKKILNIEGVDATRTTTTNIEEIANTLGIEAARNTLISEIKNTLEQQGVSVDVRYIALVADAMCVNGIIESIGRYGIMKHKDSVLARLNFEETIKILFNSAILNKKDKLNTLMANLMIGQISPVGTGTVKLKWKI